MYLYDTDGDDGVFVYGERKRTLDLDLQMNE